MEMAGTVNYQGDAGRMQQWFADPKMPSPWHLAGQLRGSAVLQQSAGVVHGKTTTELDNFAVVDTTGKQFQEPSFDSSRRAITTRKSKTFNSASAN